MLDSALDIPPACLQASHPNLQVAYYSADESAFFNYIMEKVKDTKLAHFWDKLAVESEPGLTDAQLMLNNHDLKPVEPERRQWGPWNFVGFWIADSFNIVSYARRGPDSILTLILLQNTWMISSTAIVSSGLSWWESWLTVRILPEASGFRNIQDRDF